jgi:hypothetical protein
MTIQVQVKNVYGNEMIYPICEQAKLFAKLANTKTLTRQSIELIKALGYAVHNIQDVVSL